MEEFRPGHREMDAARGLLYTPYLCLTFLLPLLLPPFLDDNDTLLRRSVCGGEHLVATLLS